MDATAQFEQLTEAIEKLGLDVRYENLGGQSTGLCRIRGQSVMFVDLDADVATRMDQCFRALASIPDVDSTYLPPAIRERLDHLKKIDG